jgi:hypothetical protein
MLQASLKTIAIGLIAFIIMYYLLNSYHLRKALFPISFSFFEGLENMDATKTEQDNNAASSTSFVAGLKAQIIKMQDELLVAKYRKEYEDAIINMDDYIGFLMLKEVLNTNLDKENVVKSANNLNALRGMKDSLNTTMKFLDSVN